MNKKTKRHCTQGADTINAYMQLAHKIAGMRCRYICMAEDDEPAEQLEALQRRIDSLTSEVLTLACPFEAGDEVVALIWEEGNPPRFGEVLAIRTDSYPDRTGYSLLVEDVRGDTLPAGLARTFHIHDSELPCLVDVDSNDIFCPAPSLSMGEQS